MDYGLKERLENIRNDLVLIMNLHQKEFTLYESRKLDEAYWALVDIFDKRKQEEHDRISKEVEEEIKKELKQWKENKENLENLSNVL